MNKMNLQTNSKILFTGEKMAYTVKACNERYAICTKPFNLKKTVLYTIVDLEQGVRGTNDFVFNPYDFKSQEDIEQCLRDLVNGSVGISRRNSVPLAITTN
jgi:hypothetical protein